MRYRGQSGQPKGASIVMTAEQVKTDEAHSIDMRSDDEKDRDAVNNWMRWRGHIGHLEKRDGTLLIAGVNETGSVLWLDKRPTAQGLSTLAALRSLADVIEKRG